MFSRALNKNRTTCPRCLGKGEVDWDDIKRLEKELKWAPGTCAYCNGKGKVPKAMVDNVDPSMTYLSLDIPKDERDRLIKGESGAIDRANYHEVQSSQMISEIGYLYFTGKMSVDQIVGFFFLEAEESESMESDKVEFADYVSRVIKKSKETEANSASYVKRPGEQG